jgi:rhodanese-related sulfurtransferase
VVAALRRKTNDQEQRIIALEETVAELESLVASLDERAPDPARLAYEDMSRDDKVSVVCSKLQSEAAATTGAAKATYTDVIRMFDGQVSAGHAYGLMEAAGRREGCRYDEGADGVKRVTFRAGRVKDSREVSHRE